MATQQLQIHTKVFSLERPDLPWLSISLPPGPTCQEKNTGFCFFFEHAYMAGSGPAAGGGWGGVRRGWGRDRCKATASSWPALGKTRGLSWGRHERLRGQRHRYVRTASGGCARCSSCSRSSRLPGLDGASCQDRGGAGWGGGVDERWRKGSAKAAEQIGADPARRRGGAAVRVREAPAEAAAGDGAGGAGGEAHGLAGPATRRMGWPRGSRGGE